MSGKFARVSVVVVVLGLALTPPVLEAGAAPHPPQTQSDLDLAACNDLAKAEKDLKAVYARLSAALTSQPADHARLQRAQEAWQEYRDAQFTFLHPPSSPDDGRGSIEPMCACLAKRDLTLARTKELRSILNGPEGDVCMFPLP